MFSLRDNKLITLYKFPEHQYKDEDSLFVTVAIDVRDTTNNCKDTFAYIADVTGFALIVYDFRNSRSWRINNNLFYPYPPYGTFNIKGDTFDLMDGILGLALGPIQNGDRILYFHSLASRVESWVPTSIIRWIMIVNIWLFRHCSLSCHGLNEFTRAGRNIFGRSGCWSEIRAWIFRLSRPSMNIFSQTVKSRVAVAHTRQLQNCYKIT